MFSFPSDPIDPWRAACRRERHAGDFALCDLPRLSPLLADTRGVVSYRFDFGVDNEGRHVVRGYVRTTLALRCQRCLEIVEHPVDAETSLALVQSMDEVARLPDRYEPCLIKERLLHPMGLVEDELLLAVPLVPAHSPGSCALPARERGSLPPAACRRAPPHPFAALAAWKSSRSDP